jgi:uncharacterized membrane protein YgcG
VTLLATTSLSWGPSMACELLPTRLMTQPKTWTLDSDAKVERRVARGRALLVAGFIGAAGALVSCGPIIYANPKRPCYDVDGGACFETDAGSPGDGGSSDGGSSDGGSSDGGNSDGGNSDGGNGDGGM